jgi:hypothetical protein
MCYPTRIQQVVYLLGQMPQSFRLHMEKYVFIIAVISCSLGYLYQSNNYECN